MSALLQGFLFPASFQVSQAEAILSLGIYRREPRSHPSANLHNWYVSFLPEGTPADEAADGEAFPFETFHVEVHPGLASLLSLDGHFFLSEFLQKHDGHS